jgi:hypothetical protein
MAGPPGSIMSNAAAGATVPTVSCARRLARFQGNHEEAIAVSRMENVVTGSFIEAAS